MPTVTKTIKAGLPARTGESLYVQVINETTGALANAGEENLTEGSNAVFSGSVDVDSAITDWHLLVYRRQSDDSLAAWQFGLMDDDVVIGREAVASTLEAGDIPSPLMVSLLYGEQIPRAFSFTGELYLNEIAPNTIRCLERNPVNGALSAKDLSGIASLSLVVFDYAGNEVQAVANAGLDRSDDANGNVGWTNSSDVTSSERKLRVNLWNDAGPVLLMEGSLTVKYAKRGS